MGTKVSKLTASKKTKGSHRCSKKCFARIKNVQEMVRFPWIFTAAHMESLEFAISNSELPFALAPVISSFLDSVAKYCKSFHGAINEYIDNGGLICKKWIQQELGGSNDFAALKVLVFGTGAYSWRSDLVCRFLCDTYSDDYDFWEEGGRKQLTIDGFGNIKKGLIVVDVMEVNGSQDDFWNIMFDQWTRETQMIMLCFDVKDPSSLDYCVEKFKSIPKTLEAESNEEIEKGVVLVGCRMDLLYETELEDCEKDEMMKVYRRAHELSKEWNIPFVDTSAKKNVNVHWLFKQIVYEYWLQSQTHSVCWLDSMFRCYYHSRYNCKKCHITTKKGLLLNTPRYKANTINI